ncbi:MAG: dUTP diphosphatase [Pseudobdellovibrionaceae bacterium]
MAFFQQVKLKIKTLPHFFGDLPQYQTPGSSGFDVRAQIREPITLKPLERAIVPTGLSFEIPPGYEIQSRPRSGLAAKQGLSILNTPGTIDSDYRGEVKIILVNLSSEPITIQDQDRCAQLILAPVVQAQFELATDFTATERGAGGFGSTGV